MRDLLMIVGSAMLILLGILLVHSLLCGLKNLSDALKRRYIIKHRFDKPPTAKCYCRDCERHDDESNRCYKFDGWYTADNWFCWDAEPRKDINQ